MKIVLLDEARRRFEAEDEWWRSNRDAKEIFIEEFEQALEKLRSMPGIGQRYRFVRGKLIQRVLMKKTGCHVYYFHDRERDLSWRSTRSGVPVENAVRGCSDEPSRRRISRRCGLPSTPLFAEKLPPAAGSRRG